ncbi:MAG: C1 family peptidase [Acetobacteraceae bacterium]
MPKKATLTHHKVQHYGWVPDLPDARDHGYAAPRAVMVKLPTHIDLRPQCPVIYDQGQLGSCTGNAIAGAVQFERAKQKLTPDFIPSRLFIYYNERVIEGTVGTDAGAAIRDGIKVVATLGVPPETDWGYDIAKFAQKPPVAAFTDALKDKALSYQRISHSLTQMKGCLASGYPFVFGFTVYDSFESQTVAQTGVVPMPGPGETVLGGHATLAVGYDDSQQRFIVRNSWGETWGMKGYFTIPYTYLTQRSLSSDFWTIRLVASH